MREARVVFVARAFAAGSVKSLMARFEVSQCVTLSYADMLT